MRVVLLLVALVTAFVPVFAPAAPAPIFTFHNTFWTNLHHFLYAVGRGRNDASDARRPVIAAALADETAGTAQLGDTERAVWDDALRFYREGPSKRNAVFDKGLTANTRAIASAADAATLGDGVPDAPLARMLERAAPMYRNVWWARHRRANAEKIADLERLIAAHGSAVLARVTNAYGREWPQSGRAIQMCGYANWSGAYSTDGGLIVFSSLDPLTKGAHGFEILLHEAAHQWDDQVFDMLREEARRQKKRVPGDLSHVMIFYTAGDAVQREIPDHVPYAEINGMWIRGPFAPFKRALDRAWLPWLDGKSSREEAIAGVIGEI